MPWRVQHLDFEIANGEGVAVGEVLVAILERQFAAVADFGVCHVLQLKGADDVVFVAVRFKYVPYFCAFPLSKARVDLAVAAGVYDGCFAVVGQKVAVVGDAFGLDGF